MPRGRSKRPSRRGATAGMLRLVFGLVIALAVVIFAVSNNEPIQLRFLGQAFPSVALPILMFACLLVGAVAVTLIGGGELRRARRHAWDLERRLAASGSPRDGDVPGPPPPAHIEVRVSDPAGHESGDNPQPPALRRLRSAIGQVPPSREKAP